MIAAHGISEGGALDRWSDTLADLRTRIAHRFARAEVRARVGRYLAGLLGRVERKNGWQLAEAIGAREPRGVQRLLSAASWDAEGVRDDLRIYVVEHLGEPESGVLIIDDTGFVKKGDKSVGVARQYTGTVGDTANAQVGVFLAYASVKGTAFMDRALYLPRTWTDDRERCREAETPSTVRFATKLALAQRMLERAFAAAVPARWLVANSCYGRSHAFRRWLEERERAYVLMVPKTHAVWYQGRREARGAAPHRGLGAALGGHGRPRGTPTAVGLSATVRGVSRRDAAVAARAARRGRPERPRLPPGLRPRGDTRGGAAAGVRPPLAD